MNFREWNYMKTNFTGVSHTTLRYYFGFLKAALALYRRNKKQKKSR